MTNYKPYGHNALIFDGYIYYTNKVTTLANNALPDTTGKSVHDFTNAADYTVPTGKKFRLIAGKFLRNISNRFQTIYYSDAANAETNPVIMAALDTPATATAYNTHDYFVFPHLPEAPAGKYINIKANSATTPGYFIQLYGVELDA